MSELKDFQKTFIELALQSNALEFGKFKLKSGRDSPYFFNAAKMLNGCDLFKLANCYVDAINDARMEFDCLYGPAYKGIFLGSIVATVLSQRGNPCPLSFNRKEIKDHGEGGIIIGAPVRGRVLIIDDVISAGTSINEAVSIINSHDGDACGIIVAIDRQEKGAGDISAIQDVSNKFNIPTLSIITLDNIIEYLASQNTFKNELKFIKEYRKEYGVN